MELNSFSSALMLGTTLYRNQEGLGNKIIAQAGYQLIAKIALTETVAALAFSALSLIAYPISSEPFEHAIKWLRSSAFSLGWSIIDFFLNPFMKVMVADEKSARQILYSRNLVLIPTGAVI